MEEVLARQLDGLLPKEAPAGHKGSQGGALGHVRARIRQLTIADAASAH